MTDVNKGPRCQKCTYFEAPTIVTNGLCRVQPPQFRDRDGFAVWPKVRTEDWCGCYVWAGEVKS